MRTPAFRIQKGNLLPLEVSLASAIGKVLQDVFRALRAWRWPQWVLATCVIAGLLVAVRFLVHPPEVMGSSASRTHRCGCI